MPFDAGSREFFLLDEGRSIRYANAVAVRLPLQSSDEGAHEADVHNQVFLLYKCKVALSKSSLVPRRFLVQKIL